jgi:C1A family cysteine protease
MCGSCWAYGAIGPIESIAAIQTGRYVELPEQLIVDCAWTNGTGASGGNFGCDGGDSDIGALEIVRKFGGVIPTAASYGSYLAVNGYCKDMRLMDVGAKITGWVDIKPRDEHAILEALSTKGPLNVNIMVPDEMLYYESGVLKVDSCHYDPSQIDHSVVLTGYGTDEHGTDYYTIRNSWSTYWGNQGYINIARGDLDCCVGCEAGYPELAVAATSVVV